MSERKHYEAGVPCWVETLQPDVDAALDFYGPLFGWEFDGPGPMPANGTGRTFVARLHGRDVAGIGSLADPGGSDTPAWITHIRVDDAADAAVRARRAGGTVLAGPLEARPAGRLALLADPAGARFGVWEAGSREGAQLVNEARAWALSSLRTPDPEGSVDFYGRLFGWAGEPFGGFTMWRLPDYVGGVPTQGVPRDVVGIMTALGAAGAPGRAHWRVDFFVDDADATAAAADRLGGTVLEPPADSPGFRSALLADPQGATFTITQPVPAPGA